MIDQAHLPPSIWYRQKTHFSILGLLVIAVVSGWVYFGRPQAISFFIALSFPIAHQIFVWRIWRKRLNDLPTLSFKKYLIGFFLLFGLRFVSLAHLAGIDETRLGISTEIRFGIVAICFLIGGYAMYSVARYFGLKRAAGADHFFPEFRAQPMVREGIFRFTNNGMYVYAFLLVWLIPFFFDSVAALLVAGFSHLYIWVHYFTLEKPDMDYLYR